MPGIWLDHSELNKLLEKEETRFEEVEKQVSSPKREEKAPKKESFLSEIFEMFGD